MPPTVEELLRDVNNKLDQLIKIVSLQALTEKSVTEGARMLKTAGLDNQTISEILNTTPGTIRSLTTHLRKKRV